MKYFKLTNKIKKTELTLELEMCIMIYFPIIMSEQRNEQEMVYINEIIFRKNNLMQIIENETYKEFMNKKRS